MNNEIVLQVHNLTKTFNGSTAVDQLSLEVCRGEIFGFLGPNGAGKTTSINMMVGLLEPTSGDVLIEGQSIHNHRDRVLNRIGVCPQETILWDKLTCLEQLEFVGANYNLPRKQARQRGAELLEALGLSAKANELAGRLSGGMKRRLNLALALVHDPQIIFLDEPEAGLDPQSRVLVRDYIRLLARRKTVVLTTHDMDEAERLADRVAIIDHGRLLVVNTPQELKRRLGEGSVVEIELGDCSDAAVQPALQQIRQRFADAQPRFADAQPHLADAQPRFADAAWANGLLSVRGTDLAARLPELLQTLQAAGLSAGDIRMRAITLEDVFLSLTGRGLRE